MAEFRRRKLDIGGTVSSGVARGELEGIGKALSKSFDAIGVGFSDQAAAAPLMRQAHKRLGEAMQTAVLHSYDQVVTARKTIPSYRQPGNPQGESPRYSGGALRNALESDTMVKTDANGISFIDTTTLDAEAKHWYRLNFGAGDKQGRPAYEFNWQIGGQSLGFLSLANPPSPAFRMPRGIWSTGEGGLPAGFYPRGRALVSLPVSIGPRRFLDAGLDRFSKNFPVVYGDLLDQFNRQALQSGGALHDTPVNIKLITGI